MWRTIAAAALALLLITSPIGAQSQAPPPQCGIQQPAFCETFDQPTDNTGGNVRSGQLDGMLWGVSRATGFANFGQTQFNAWSPTLQVQCDGSLSTVQPPNDVIVCGHQVREAVNDNTGVTVLAMYPKQPFDFAGRTGIIAFDVSNDTQGAHTAWPELWLTDQPVPAPFTHAASWFAAPRNGVGIRLSASTLPFEGPSIAQICPSDNHPRWSAESVVVSRNYVVDDQTEVGHTTSLKMLDCVIASSGPNDGLNHVEVHVSQSQIDVWATDAGTTAPLHHLATAPNANLSFTRGLVWLEDAHYNADKFGQHDQKQHTFAWANVGFDGPVLPRDLTFDVPDAGSPTGQQVNLGYNAQPGTVPLPITGVQHLQDAAAALLTFNFFHYAPPSTITYVVNGHSHAVPWPYPDQTGGSWRALAALVPFSELVAGTNTVSFSFDQVETIVSNVDLVLVGAGGLPAPLPTAQVPNATGTTTPVDTPTATVTPTPTPTAVSAVTPTATTPPSTCQVLIQLNGQINSVNRPASFCTDQP